MVIGLNAQENDACTVRAYPSKVRGQMVLEYAVGTTEGHFSMVGEVKGEIGMRGLTSTMKDGLKIQTYRYCYTIPDSTHFWVPSGKVEKDGAVNCTINGYWVAVDTLDWSYTDNDEEIYTFNCVPTDWKKLAQIPEFEWIAGIEPEIDIMVSKKVALGDTMHITIESNFPLDEVLRRLRLKNLLSYGYGKSESSVNRKEEKISGWHYSETIIVYAAMRGTALVEPMEFEYLGKTIKVPGIKIKIKQNSP